jgi:hypothetical protein
LTFPTELPVKAFLHAFFGQIPPVKRLETIWIKLLMSFTEHKDIPDNSTVKARAYVLLAFILDPVMKLVTISPDEIGSMSEEQQEQFNDLEQQALKAFNALPLGFHLDEFGVICAKEFSDILLEHHVFIVHDTSIASSFRSMMKYDVSI